MIAPRTFQSVTCIVFSIVVYPTQETFIKNSRELRVEIIKMTTINDVDMCINYMCMLENTTKDSYKQTNKHSTIFCYNLAIVYKKKNVYNNKNYNIIAITYTLKRTPWKV